MVMDTFCYVLIEADKCEIWCWIIESYILCWFKLMVTSIYSSTTLLLSVLFCKVLTMYFNLFFLKTEILDLHNIKREMPYITNLILKKHKNCTIFDLLLPFYSLFILYITTITHVWLHVLAFLTVQFSWRIALKIGTHKIKGVPKNLPNNKVALKYDLIEFRLYWMLMHR
jgi:hypothetical protein